ncbi:Alpha-1,3-arabinosyltransferase XAT2 [Linum grandiflorum]
MMMYDSLLARSFSKHEQKKMRRGALITCLLIVITFSSIFKPQWPPLPSSTWWSPGVLHKLNLLINATDTSSPHLEKINEDGRARMKESSYVKDTNHSDIDDQLKEKGSAVKKHKKIVWSRMCSTGGRSEFCDIQGDVRVDPNSATVYYVIPSNTTTVLGPVTVSIRPYGRNGDTAPMGLVREWSLQMVPQLVDLPHCSRLHHSPALLFSLGGFSGNYFHAFTDLLIPLFATARNFNRRVLFLITDHRPWLLSTFRIFLQALSSYNPVDIDNVGGNGKEIHCFSRLILGLKGRHNMELSVNPSESDYTIKDFRKFLRNTYSLKRPTAIKLVASGHKKLIMPPRLLIISRNKTRAFTNVNEIARMARKLGYEVTVAELDRNMSRSAEIMNSCDVVVGVHGAGLTNMVFLPENAVLIQVVPLAADFVSRTYFEEPSKDMNVRYLEYKINKEESSLMDKYPPDHLVFTKPSLFMKQGWDAFKSIYLDNQNVKLDIRRFRGTLLKALELLK